MRATGLIVPSAFETWLSATILVRGESRRSKAAMSTSPASSIGATRSFASFSPHSSCQGTMFEWCSSPVISTSSPLATWRRP
jgi:hypothetical protein